MAALAPLLLEPTILEEPLEFTLDPGLVDPAVIERDIAEQNLVLAKSREVPDSVRFFVEGLADDMTLLPSDAALRIDPYLLVALQKALLAGLRALENPDAAAARQDLRVRLEQLRQVYRDLADARPIFEDQPPSELVRWLDDVLDVPQARLAELIGVSTRTLQRWISPSDPGEPVGLDGQRVRLIANLVSHLRHALTGLGVVEWFERPHPLAHGKRPADLLDEPSAMPQLTRLAASTRSTLAA